MTTRAIDGMIRELQTTTPIHNHLWHKGYILLSLSGMLLVMSAYILLAFYPLHLFNASSFSASADVPLQLSIVAYGVGVFAFGFIANWLVQRYRRGAVCVNAILLYALCVLVTFFMLKNHQKVHIAIFVALRFLTAAFYGLASITIYATLIIDKSESWLRTRANHSAAWLVRIGMVLAPLAAIVMCRNVTAEYICMLSFILALLSAFLVRMTRMPFKTPEEDVRMFSLDRFLMPRASLLFLSTFCVFSCYGILMSRITSVAFYGLILSGFLWTLVLEHWSNANNSGNRDLFVAAAFVLMGLSVYGTFTTDFYSCLATAMFGAGLGMFGAKAQLAFVERSKHCQRGTAVATCFLACESGVVMGLAFGSFLH